MRPWSAWNSSWSWHRSSHLRLPAFCVEVVPRLRSAYRRFMRSVERVEWQRDEEGA